MATWEEISREIDQSNPDQVRRSKLHDLFVLTNRPVILYGTEMFNRQKIQAVNGDIAIDLSDKDGFIECLKGLDGANLDVVIHSPGGSAEATESIVNILRRRFSHIRFIIPNVAKSAATMLAMSGNEVILGDDAELGPTDPQMVIGGRLNPAHAIVRQFDKAKKELGKNTSLIPAWLPILQQYAPSLLIECENAIALSERLVKEWIAKYMLVGMPRAKSKAAYISKYLAGKQHLSHARSVSIDELQRKGAKITWARDCEPSLSTVVADINHALIQTFMRTGVFKLFENHLGKGLYKVVQQQVIQLPMNPAAQGQQPNR